MPIDDYQRECRETRLLPLAGDANIIVGFQSYAQEMRFRVERIAAGVPFSLPKWEELEIYDTKSPTPTNNTNTLCHLIGA